MADDDCRYVEADDGQCHLALDDDTRCPEPQEPGAPFCTGHVEQMKPAIIAYLARLN